MGMRISEIITDKYKLRIPPTVYYELLADVQELEEEEEPITKNNLGVDAVSRDIVKRYIQAHIHEIITESGEDKNKHTNRVLRSLIHGVNCMPSVTPQEPIAWIVGKNNAKIAVKNMPIDKLQKICAIIGDEQESVLDKLRAEILEEKECAYADFERYKVEYLGQDWEDALDSLPQDDFRYGMERAIELIDKYKAGQEK